MAGLKKFRDRVLSLKVLIGKSDLSEAWKQIARDAVLAWVAAMTEEEVIRNSGVWP